MAWGGNKEERPCFAPGLLGKWVYLVGVRRNGRGFAWFLLWSNCSGLRALKMLTGGSAWGHRANKKRAGSSVHACELCLLHSLALWLTLGLQLCWKALVPSEGSLANLWFGPERSEVCSVPLCSGAPGAPGPGGCMSQCPAPSPHGGSNLYPSAGGFWGGSQGSTRSISAGCQCHTSRCLLRLVRWHEDAVRTCRLQEP